jgi:hypothetical protein
MVSFRFEPTQKIAAAIGPTLKGRVDGGRDILVPPRYATRRL